MVLVAYKPYVYIELCKLTIHIFELAITLSLFHTVSVPSFPSQESRMTTWDLITALFYHVDEQLHDMPKHPEAHLWPSEVVTLGLLHALKGVGNRPFYGPNIAKLLQGATSFHLIVLSRCFCSCFYETCIV